VNWIGDGAIDDAPRREVFVKVRSTRPPQPAWLSLGRNGIAVELTGGEEGVAPGQACVFYDAAEGEARVLGGGFIRSAEAAVVAPREGVAAHA
jgi:tRNA-specific 2-thiouridylase